MADYTLSAKATFDGSNFDKGIKGSESALDSFKSKCSAISIAVGNVLAQGFGKAVEVVSASVDKAVSRVDTMRNFPKVMSNLGYSSEDASAAIQKMSDRLSGLPTTLDSMTSGVQRLVPSVQDVGKATDIMLAFNDAVLAGGAPVEVQASAIEQFSQSVSKGKFELEEWRSICTAMPGQMDQMAKSLLGATAGQQDLYEAMKNGDVTMDQFLDKLVELDTVGGEGFASFQQQAEDGVAGISTAMANASNAVTKGVASIIEGIGVENIVGVINTIKTGITDGFNAAAGAVQTFVGQIQDNGAVQTASEIFGTLAQAASDVGGAVGGIVGSLLGIPEGTDPAVAAADALKAALEAARPIVEGIGDACAWLKDNASEVAPIVAGLVAAFLGFRVVQGIVGFVTSFQTALGGIGSAAAPATTALGQIGGAASMSAPQILALGAAIALVGVGVLAASAGLYVLAQAAIQIAAAGPMAAVAMVALVAAIVGLAAGASVVGPALTAGAVGIAAFGAAVLMVGAGILLATAGITLLSTQLPMIATYGASAAVGIAALGAGMLAFAPGAIAAGAAVLVLSAGLLAAGAAALVLGAAVVVIGAGITLAAAGMALMSAQLPIIASLGTTAAVGLAALGAAALVASPGLLAAGAAATVFGVGMTAASVGVVAAAAAITVAAAAVTLFGAAIMVAAAGVAMLGATLPTVTAGGASAGAAMTALAAGMTLLGAGALVAGAGVAVLGAGVLVASAGIIAFGAAVTVAAAGVTLLGAGMTVLAAAVILLATGVVIAAAGITAMGAALPTIAESAPTAAAGIAAFAAAAAAATVGLLAGTPALVAYAAAASTAATGVTAAATGTVLLGTGITVVASAAPMAASGLTALAVAASSAAPSLASAAPSLIAAASASAQAASGFTTAAAAAAALAVSFAAAVVSATAMATGFTAASTAVVAAMTLATASVTMFTTMTTAQFAALVAVVQSSMAIFTREMSQQSVLAMQMFIIAIQQGIAQAVALFATLRSQIVSILSGLSGALYSSGLAMMQGFVRGIQQGMSQAVAAVSAGMSQIRAYFPFSPAKKGPLSGRGYTTYSGEALMEGFAEGIEDGADAPVKAVSKVGQEVSDTAWEYGYHAAVSYSDGLSSGTSLVADAAGSMGDAATGAMEDSDAEMQAYIDKMIAGYRERSHELQQVSSELGDVIWGALMPNIKALGYAKPETGEVYDSMKVLEAAGYNLDSYKDKIQEIAEERADWEKKIAKGDLSDTEKESYDEWLSEANEFIAMQDKLTASVGDMEHWQSLYKMKDDLITDMDAATSWSDTLGKLFNKTGVRYSKNFVERVMEGGDDYKDALAQMADMTDEQVQAMVDSFDDLARAEREQELNQRSLYVNSLQYFDMTDPKDWLLDFRETCLDVKEAIYSDSGLSNAFQMAGVSVEGFASSLRGMDVTMEDFVSGMQDFTSTVANGFDQMTAYGKTGLDEWEQNLRLNMAESQAYADNLVTVFNKIPEGIDTEAFRKAVYEGGFDQWGQVIADMAEKSSAEIGEYIQLYNDALIEGQQSAIEQFQALSPGDDVVNSLIAGIEAGKEQLAESMGGLLTDSMAMVAEGDQAETFATSIGQALTNAFASDEVLEQTATAMQGVVANMGQGLLSNQALVTDSVATVSEQGNATAASFYDAFYGTGQQLAMGIAAGIQSKINEIAAAAAAVVRAAIAAARAAAAVASPSKVMRDQVGAMMSAGLAVGIEKTGYMAAEAMEDVTSGAIDAASALSLAPAGGYSYGLGTTRAGEYAEGGGYYSYGGDTWNVYVRDDRDLDALQKDMNRNQERKMRAVGLA